MGGGSTPQFQPPAGLPPGLPDYINFLDPENIGQAGAGSAAYNTAANTDRQSILDTKNFWRQISPDYAKSVKIANRQNLTFQTQDPNADAVRDAMLRSGLQASAGAFGDNTQNDAGIARNLGLGIADYAQGLRTERRASMRDTGALPFNTPIQVGYTGKDALELAMNESANQNNYNTAGYQIGAGMAGTELQGQIASANSSAATTGAGIGAIGSILAAIIGGVAL